MSEVNVLHIAVCNAVGLLNQSILTSPEERQAHDILRQALVDYADADAESLPNLDKQSRLYQEAAAKDEELQSVKSRHSRILAIMNWAIPATDEDAGQESECPACGAHIVVGGNKMECAARCGWHAERAVAGQVRDWTVGDVIAAYPDGTVVLDDGMTIWNDIRAKEFLKDAATFDLMDEVQRRMDAVVDAAVEWHQAGREGAEWFDKAEVLGTAIDSLLELRDKPAGQGETDDSSKAETAPCHSENVVAKDSEWDAAEDRVDKWLQTTGLEVARASALGYINGNNEALVGAISLIEWMIKNNAEPLRLMGERIIHQIRGRIRESGSPTQATVSPQADGPTTVPDLGSASSPLSAAGIRAGSEDESSTPAESGEGGVTSADQAFDKWWATKEAEGYQYGREPLSNVRFGFRAGYAATFPSPDLSRLAAQAAEMIEPELELYPPLSKSRRAKIAVIITQVFTDYQEVDNSRDEAIAWLKSIGVDTDEERVLLAQFLATQPTVEQIHLATSLAIQQRGRTDKASGEVGKE